MQPTDPVEIPWSTGFEDSFCDYTEVAGYCYGDRPYVLVTEPERPESRSVAEFAALAKGQHQTRCVRQGEFPEAAYYGAWYFIPEAPSAVNLWNLFHFVGGEKPGQALPKLWDVSLVKSSQPAGGWELLVFDPLAPSNDNTYRSADHKTVPIGTWFHIVLFLKRAADSTGKIALYQDDVLLFERANLKSDASKFTQWYVGNLLELADSAAPVDSRLYVDDVTIGATRALGSANP